MLKKNIQISIILFTILSLPQIICAENIVINVKLGKIILKAGSKQETSIKMKNTSSKPISGILVVSDCHELDITSQLLKQNVSLSAGKSKDFKLKFKVPDIEFGAEIKVQFISGQNKYEERAFYTVFKDNPAKVTVRYMTTFGRAVPRDGNNENFIKMLCRRYVTIFELYSNSPGMWAKMISSKKYWRSGQGAYPESKQAIKDVVNAGHKSGIFALTYYQPVMYGLSGMDFFRKYPEFCTYNKQGRPIVYFNQHALKNLHNDTDPVKSAWNTSAMRGGFGAGINCADSNCIYYGLEQLRKATKCYNFDGVRWDGTPALGIYPYSHLGIGKLYYNIKGTPYTKTVRNIDLYNAKILDIFEKGMEKVKLDFIRGFNWSPRSTGNIAENDPISYRKQINNSFQVDETLVLTSESRTGRTSDPDWLWEPYIKRIKASVALLDNTSAAHMSIMHTIPNMIYNRTLTTLLYASRTRIFGGWYSHPSPNRTIAMAFRYSALLFDKVNPVPKHNLSSRKAFYNYLNGIYSYDNISNFIVVSPVKIWWQPFCYERHPDNKTVQDIVHIVNPPVKAYRDHKVTKVNPPVKNIVIKIAKRPGMKIRNVFVLDDERNNFKYEPFWRQKEKYIEIRPQPLKYWNIIIVTWSKNIEFKH